MRQRIYPFRENREAAVCATCGDVIYCGDLAYFLGGDVMCSDCVADAQFIAQADDDFGLDRNCEFDY